MDASTATPGSPDDGSLSTLSSRPRPRRYRRKKHSMGRGFDAFLASKASKLARRRRDSSVQDCEKYTDEAARKGYAAVRERKRQDFILECGDKAPPEPLTELVAMQNPEKPGTWVWSSRLAALLEKQEDHAPVPKHPVDLPEYIVDCEDWEWITAIVRSVLLHNIDHFEHTYSAIERGDKYFMGGRAETIFKTAVTVRPPKLYGPETLPRLPESDSESSEGENIFRGDFEDFMMEKNRPTPGQLLRMAAARRKKRELPSAEDSARLLEYAWDLGDRDKLQLVEAEFEHLTRRAKTKAKARDDVVKGPSRRGERDLRNLWHGSWGKALGREAELKRLEKVREKRRLALKPAWRSLVEPEPEKTPQKVEYQPTRVENRVDRAQLRRKMKGAGQLFFFQRRVERDAKSKISDEVLARRAAREAAQQLREGAVVRALMAFDAERLKVFEQLKVVRAVCADPESLNSQKRDAMQDLIEALGPPEPLRKPPIKGMQRATIDAVEAIATWHAGEVAAPVVIEEEPEAEAPAPADKGPQTMAEKLAEIKKRAAEAEYAVRNRTPPPTPPPDPPPFLWNGVDFLLCVRTSMDFLDHSPEFRAHVGDDFPMRDNPFMLPTGIDGDADDEGASDGGEDLASDSDDDEAEKKRKEKKRELRARASTWPRLGDSEHRDRVHKCREYVLAHERRYRAREEAERVALANARKVRNEDVARRKLFARAKTHPWEFLDANDPDGSKAERKRRNRRVVRKPGSESLPAIRVRL